MVILKWSRRRRFTDSMDRLTRKKVCPHRNEMPKGSTQGYRMIDGDLMKRKRLQPTKPSWALAFLADLLMVSRVLWIGS